MKDTKLVFGIILFLLMVCSAGYAQKIDSVAHLKEKATNLHEVKITTSKKIISNKNGNIKMDIENSILSAIPNTVSLLAKLPAVQVSPDGEKLSVIGRGEPLIYLDNQRIKMEDLASLSTSDIKSIELVNNPSAKYEAEGRSVIIITLKKGKSDGVKVDLTETASFKTYFQNRAGINVNVKRNRLEFKGNVQYNYLNLWESNGNDFRIPAKDLISDYTVVSAGLRQQTVVSGGVYYQINNDDYLSFNTSKRVQKENFTIATTSFLKQPLKEDDVITQNLNTESRPFFNSILNYNKKFKDLGGQLFIGGQYSQFSQNIGSSIFNNYNNKGTAISQNRDQNYVVDVLTGRADFEKSFKNEMKWETGTNVSVAKSNSLLNMVTYNPQNATGSDYDYKEKIYAAYTQLSGKLNKVNYSAGLRMENTNVKAGYRDSIALSVNRNYTQLFPKGSVNLPLGETKTLTFAYAKSIIRPNYSTSSQITTYINPFFEWSHNINISPGINHEVSATVQYKESSWGVSYYRINNPVYYSVDYNDQTGTLRMIDKNYALESGVNLNVVMPFKSGIWTSTNTLTASKDQVKDSAAILTGSKPYVYIYSNNQFKLPRGYSLMVSGWGITKRKEGVFERNAMYSIDTAITKTFYKKLVCTMGYNSILNTGQAKEDFAVNTISSRGVYYLDNREFTMSVKYAFGKLKDSKYKNRDANDNLNRIK